jgi:Big-like domain-containing protein
MSKVLTVVPKEIFIQATDRPVQLAVTDDTETVVTGEVSFESDNTSVASVSAGGLVTPKGKGKATVTVLRPGDKATAKVAVVIS